MFNKWLKIIKTCQKKKSVTWSLDPQNIPNIFNSQESWICIGLHVNGCLSSSTRFNVFHIYYRVKNMILSREDKSNVHLNFSNDKGSRGWTLIEGFLLLLPKWRLKKGFCSVQCCHLGIFCFSCGISISPFSVKRNPNPRPLLSPLTKKKIKLNSLFLRLFPINNRQTRKILLITRHPFCHINIVLRRDILGFWFLLGIFFTTLLEFFPLHSPYCI